MPFRSMFPRALAVCLVLGLTAAHAGAQTITRPRQVGGEAQTSTTTTMTGGEARLENDVYVVSAAPEAEEETSGVAPARRADAGEFELMMLAAIDRRLGVPYRLGTQGPTRYDCSGFVWSVFQSVGVDFERSNARTFWNEFLPVREGEKYKFGTLVFFNNLQHVGIVVDENGFYHASSSKGVTYSPFNEYWSKRITGFRRIPLRGADQMIAFSGK